MADMYQVLKNKLRSGLWNKYIGPIQDSGTALYFPLPALSSHRVLHTAAVKPLVTVTPTMIVIRFEQQEVQIRSIEDTANIVLACSYCYQFGNAASYKKILYFLQEIYPNL
jgi:hypothetical protein